MSDKTSTENRYRIVYRIKPLEGEGLTKEELQAHPKYGPEDWGFADKVIVGSILESETGRSTMIFSRQHDGSSLPVTEIYEFVVLLCRQLAMGGKLGEVEEHNCWMVFNAHLTKMGLPPQTLERARERFGVDGPIEHHRKPTDG